MSAAAPPVEPEAPGPPPERGDGDSAAAIAAAAVRGLAAFGIVTAVGVAIGMAEYAATKGAYRPWTWIKVGFLYVLSFCGVTIRAQSLRSDLHTPVPTLDFRIPMMTGAALVIWLLFRAGRKAADVTSGRERRLTVAAAGAVATGLSFAIPAFLVSLPSTLRFPDLDASIAPIRWQSALFPLILALGASSAGALWGWCPRACEATRLETLRTVLAGGWTMFVAAVALALLGFLLLAAVKTTQTGDYARYMRDAGRGGVILVVHHALLLPDQSIWILGPAMGGSTTLATVEDPPVAPAVVRMSGVGMGDLAFTCSAESSSQACKVGGRVPLGGGFYLFALVPSAATVLGGRRAAGGAKGLRRRAIQAVGAGLVFAGLMFLAAGFSASTLPTGLGMLPLSIHADLPSTATLALIWGVAGGVLGALSSRWPASAVAAVEDQEPAEPG